MSYDQLPSMEIIQHTIDALESNGIDAELVETFDDAKAATLKNIPHGAEVMNMTSVTLETIGVVDEILNSGNYNAVRNTFKTLDDATYHQDRLKLGAAPAYALGSVHAVTEDGHILIASQTGSQLAAHVYGAGKVIFVVGAQKIVKDFNQATDRIYNHSLPLEAERARKAYGAPGSAVNKLLIINKEIVKDRIKLILINQVVGF